MSKIRLNEDIEGKNINKAEKLIRQLHSDVNNARSYVTDVRNQLPSSRLPKLPNGKDSCKFLKGATRLYYHMDDYDDNGYYARLSRLDQMINLIAFKYADEFDNDLNGLSYDQLYARFKDEIKQKLADDMRELSTMKFKKNNDYDIVLIPNFNEAHKYEKYSFWCVTDDKKAFDDYTLHGEKTFYFCLRKGFEKLERPSEEEREENNYNQMDEYGSSMIAILVNSDGSFDSATSRYNDITSDASSILRGEKEISEFFGVNFFDVFKPIKHGNKIKESLQNVSLSTSRQHLIESIQSSFEYINESNNVEKTDYHLYITEPNDGLKPAVRKIGRSDIKDFNVKSRYLSTCNTEKWVLYCRIFFEPKLDEVDIVEAEATLLDLLTNYRKFTGEELAEINEHDLKVVLHDFQDEIREQFGSKCIFAKRKRNSKK